MQVDNVFMYTECYNEPIVSQNGKTYNILMQCRNDNILLTCNEIIIEVRDAKPEMIFGE